MHQTVQKKTKQKTESESRKRPAARQPVASSERDAGNGMAVAAAPAISLLQAKLVVGRTNDGYEKEADHVADRATRGERVTGISSISGQGGGATQRLTLQRQEESEEEEETAAEEEETLQAKTLQRQEMPGEEDKEAVQPKLLQRQEEPEEEEETASAEEETLQPRTVQRQEEPEEEEEEAVQAKRLQRQSEEAEEEAPVESQALQRRRVPEEEEAADEERDGREALAREAEGVVSQRGGGEPLKIGVRHRLEGTIGIDLGEVRVHEGSAAAAASARLKARAFTHKENIWLGGGESQEDIGLMAHETAHVVQQGGVPRRPPASAQSELPSPVEAEQGAEMPAARSESEEIPSPEKTAPTEEAVAAEGEATVAAEPGAETATKTATEAAAPEVAEEKTEAAATKAETGPVAEGARGAKEKVEPVAAPASPAAMEAEQEAGDKQRSEAVMARVKTEARKQQGPAAAKSSARRAATSASSRASAAAPSPKSEAMAQGKAGQVENMEAQSEQVGEINQASFLDLVKAKLREMDMPANPEQMDEFKAKGGASSLRGDLASGVQQQSKQASGGLEKTVDTEPTPAAERETQDLSAQPKAPAVSDLKPEQGLPPPKPEAEVSLDKEKDDLDEEYRANNLSDERLQKANDPRFSGALEAKQEVHEHAATAPQQYRQEESDHLAKQSATVRSESGAMSLGMQATRNRSEGQLRGRQHQQMSAETQARQRIANKLESIYQRARKDVEDKLNALDDQVDAMFTIWEMRARNRFEDYVDNAFEAWKDRRYAGLSGKWTWIEDRFRDINELPEAKKIFKDGQNLYFSILETGIDVIGKYVDTTLAWCRKRIKLGREEVKDAVKTLGKDLKGAGAEAAKAIFEKFDDLKGSVDAKREELVDNLVQRYQESREKLNARIEEIKDENRSFIIRAKRKIQAVLEALDNFRKRIMSLIAEARSVIELILEDPIQFLKNLLQAVKRGFDKFSSRIWEHLKAGVFGFLFGMFAAKGINLPREFSLKAIAGFIMEVLGFTWENVKTKLSRMIGRRNAEALDKVVQFVAKLFREGPAGIWEEVKKYVGNLKVIVIDAIKDWLITKIVTAAITKLVSMFNPVGAIVQAVLTIYNVVMFFVERIEQILDLVKTVINSLGSIVRGQIEQAAGFVEKTLAKMIPLIIAFLARLLGIGGIADKVKRIINKVRKPIDRAITKVLRKIVNKVKGLLRRGGSAAKRAAGKLVQWWKRKLSFRVRGAKHSVYFKGNQLMVASKVKTADDFLKEANKLSKEAGAVEEGKQGEVAKLYGEAMALLSQVNRGRADASKTRRDKGEKAESEEEKKYLALRDKIQKIMSLLAAKVPEKSKTVIKYPGGVKMGMGVHAVAEPLSIAGDAGSEPSIEPPIWQTVRQRYEGRRTFYVRGHLINAKLHGPGNKEQNLTPISQVANKAHSDRVENKVKQFVWNRDDKNPHGKLAHYEVKALYNRPAGGLEGLKGQVDTSDKYASPKDKETAKEILEAEKSLPSQFVCEAWALQPQGKDKFKKGDTIVTTSEGTIESPPPTTLPDLAKSEKPKNVNLSTDSAEHIAENTDLTLAQAQKIVEKRSEEGYTWYRELESLGIITGDQLDILIEQSHVRLRK